VTVLEVPTVRADLRTTWVLAAFLVGDVAVIGRHLPWPIWASVTLLTAAVLVGAGVWTLRRSAKQRPPVRVTPDGLELPGAEGQPVAIDWPDITSVAFVRRGFLPHLEVRPSDPDRVRPSPNRWQRAAASPRGGYRLSVALGGTRAARADLRAALSARVPIR
jgi:hypothetical protein